MDEKNLKSEESNIPAMQENTRIERDEAGRFLPGVSGNPKGKPKTSLIAAVKAKLRANPELLNELADAVIREAKGNAQYAKELWNRLDGPVATKIEISKLTDDQVLAALTSTFETDDESEEEE